MEGYGTTGLTEERADMYEEERRTGVLWKDMSVFERLDWSVVKGQGRFYRTWSRF